MQGGMASALQGELRIRLKVAYQSQLRRNAAHGGNYIPHMLPLIHAKLSGGGFDMGSLGSGGEGLIFPFLFDGRRLEII